MKIFAINESPRMKKGNAELILEPFLQGIKDAGSETEKYYATALDIKTCSCGYFYCWDKNPVTALLTITCRYYIQNEENLMSWS
jgi:multimeric flavodoxin WrbA